MNGRWTSEQLWSPHFPFSPRQSPVFYGWIIVPVGIVGLMGSMPGQTAGFAPFTQPMMAALGLGELHMSLSYLVGTLLSGFLIPLGGRYVNRVGLRKGMFYSCLAFGLILLFLGVCDYIARGLHTVLSFLPLHWVAFTVLTVGIFFSRYFGQGMLPMISRNMMAKWFNVRRGAVLAVVGIGSSLLFSMTPRVLYGVVDVMGWRMTWILLGLILLLVFPVFVYVFYREDPEESGLQMDGGYVGKPDRKPNPELVIHHDFTMAEVRRDFSFWIYTLVISWKGLFFTGYSFLALQLAPEMGITVPHFFNLYIAVAAVSIVVNIVGGVLADYTRLKYFLILEALSMVAAPVGILLMPSVVGTVLLVGGIGFSWGCFAVISNNFYPRFYGRKNLSEIVGLSTSLQIIGCALGPSLFSVTKYFMGNYTPVMYISILVSLIMCVGAYWGDNPQRRLIALSSVENAEN